MELRLESETSDEIQITFEGEDDTLLNLLKHHLLEREEVESVSFLSGHPTLDDPVLDVSVDDGDPTESVREAAAAARNQLRTFQDLLDDEAG